MEISDVVALVLGSNFIMAVVTFFATKIQVRHSDKRFERELERARESDYHKRRWEVRSVPLIKLRCELATMATKLEKLAKQGKAFTIGKTKEQEQEALQQAENDWENYLKGDYLEKALYSQFDADIVNRVREIRNEYLDTYDIVVSDGGGLSQTEFGRAARAAEEKIRPKVVEVQELINKKLEEL